DARRRRAGDRQARRRHVRTVRPMRDVDRRRASRGAALVGALRAVRVPAMRWRLLAYRLMYRRGRTPWDTGITPPEVVDLIEGPDALPPGRALDLGCGTGTNVRYLADHGWDATGVDAEPRAVDAAERKLAGVDGARVLLGDVTRLR